MSEGKTLDWKKNINLVVGIKFAHALKLIYVEVYVTNCWRIEAEHAFSSGTGLYKGPEY